MRREATVSLLLAAGLVLGVATTPIVRVPKANAQDAKVCRFERSVEQGLGGTGISATDVLSRLTSIIPIEQGLGGTGLIDAGSRGLGGTGVVAFDERGIGGTAVIAAADERGLGGTGIIGIVTGFASVCVNGYEVEITADTDVSVEGFAGADGDIRLGQLVTVEAYPINGVLVASTVAVQVAVAGPIDSIETDRSALNIAGQTVTLAGFGDSVDATNLAPGDWVVVSGLRRGDDVIAASSVVSLDRPGNAVVVSGPVRQTVSGNLTVGAVTLDADGVSVGDVVVARGTLENNTLAAQSITVRPERPFAAGIQTFSVLGFPELGPNGATSVNGVPLPPGASASGQQPVQVNGTVDPGGAFNSSNAAPPPPPQDGVAPNAPPPPPNNTGGNGQGNGNGQNNGNGPNNNPPPPPPPNNGGGNNNGAGNGNGQGTGQNGQNGQNGNSNGQGNGTGGNAAPAPAPTLSAPSAISTPEPQPERPAQAESPQERPAAPTIVERPEAPARPVRAEPPARPERPDRPERPQQVERPERPERPETPSRPERPDRPERPR